MPAPKKADQPHCLGDYTSWTYHSWCLSSSTSVFLFVEVQWQSLTDLTVFNVQRSTKATLKNNLDKVSAEPWKNTWRNLHDVSCAYASTICLGDFVMIFSVVFSVLSVSSLWRVLLSSRRFVVFGPYSIHPSIVHTWFPPTLLVCIQSGLRRRVSTKCFCLCSWVNRNSLD